MKHYKRRAAGGFPYFKLAKWDSISLTWRDGKESFASEQAAKDSAAKPGRYRANRVEESGRIDLEPFDIGAGAEPLAAKIAKAVADDLRDCPVMASCLKQLLS